MTADPLTGYRASTISQSICDSKTVSSSSSRLGSKSKIPAWEGSATVPKSAYAEP